MQIRDILSKKGNKIYHIEPDATVFEAIKKMTELDIGALLVMDGEKLEGIISERDYRSKIILKGRTSKETHVKEIMTSEVYCVAPNESVQSCMSIMTEYKIRHLPVLNDEKVIGVVSIGDLVKSIINHQKHEISSLRTYISGRYPG